MWGAVAAKSGLPVFDWSSEAIPDPVLAGAFAGACTDLQERLIGNEFVQARNQFLQASLKLLRVGMISGREAREPLEIATRRRCRNDAEDGSFSWSAKDVCEISHSTDWDFVYGGERASYLFEIGGYWRACLFWRVCIEHSLGIIFTFTDPLTRHNG